MMSFGLNRTPLLVFYFLDHGFRFVDPVETGIDHNFVSFISTGKHPQVAKRGARRGNRGMVTVRENHYIIVADHMCLRLVIAVNELYRVAVGWSCFIEIEFLEIIFFFGSASSHTGHPFKRSRWSADK